MQVAGADRPAILMGAATVLSRLRASLRGTVIFIFQPGEEQTASPGEKGGAALMIADGLFEKTQVPPKRPFMKRTPGAWRDSRSSCVKIDCACELWTRKNGRL
jgi:hypothetical protein